MADMDDVHQEEETKGILQVIVSKVKSCFGVVMKGSPPVPCDEVQKLCDSLKMRQVHMLRMYSAFHWLKQCEDEDAYFTTASEVSSFVLPLLIDERRKYVSRLLKCIIQLGECEETASWDKFLWVMLRFCSLSRVELAQALFLCILKMRDSKTLHYIRSSELTEFFAFFNGCPIKSFDTSQIEFDLLPLRRYYASDFAELLMRFTVLLNPMLHLQQSLQAHMPGLDFWDTCTQSISFCRKITFDFFLMETGRIFLRGEPPFRETCDMLAPDALGAVPVNQDQWILRTWIAKSAGGLAHISVWGEQASPEVMELKTASREAYDERLRAEAEKHARETEAQAERLADASALGLGSLIDEEGEENAAAELAKKATAKGKAKAAPKKAWDTSSPAERKPEQSLNMHELAMRAVTLDEEFAGPMDVLPPAWMKGTTIAPALQIRGPDRPLPRPMVAPDRRFVYQGTSFGKQRQKSVTFKPGDEKKKP